MNRRLLALPLFSVIYGFGCQVQLSELVGVSLDQRVERTETHALELASGETLTLDTSYGDIAVEAADGAQPELRATVHASGRTIEEAQAILARYQVEIERGPDGPVVRLAGEPLRIRDGSQQMVLGAHVDFAAIVPGGTALVARSGSGDIRTSGALGACRAETSYGAIAIAEARGAVKARSGSGDVSAGRIDAQESTIVLESSYGDITLDDARARTIDCESGSGSVRLEAATAEAIELETSYGDVHARESSGDLRARSGSGSVRLHGVNGAIDAESSYGTVEVDGVLTRLEAESGSGNVVARARDGSRPASPWKLVSSYGSVVLEVPADFGCVLDAKTSYGSVECDFPITLEAGKKKKNDNTLKGTIGGGGETVKISSGSGDVALKKL